MLGITVQIYELIDKLPFVFQKKCHLTPKSFQNYDVYLLKNYQ